MSLWTKDHRSLMQEQGQEDRMDDYARGEDERLPDGIYGAFRDSLLHSPQNMERTENGALVYGSTGDPLADFSASVMELRNLPEKEVKERFAGAYAHDGIRAVKALFQLGDIREGKGERRTFRACMGWLASEHPEVAKAAMPLIPEYARWDYLARMAAPAKRTPGAMECAAEAKRLVVSQLTKDMREAAAGAEGKARGKDEGREGPSLLAKWMPSIQSKKPEDRKLALALESAIGRDRGAKAAMGAMFRALNAKEGAEKYPGEVRRVGHREYRQALSAVRGSLHVIERSLSTGAYGEIDQAAMTSHQNLRYGRALQRLMPDGRREFLEKVMAGEERMNAGAAAPHDIVHRYSAGRGRLEPYDMDLEALWKCLPDKVKGDASTVVIRDGSGSMTAPIMGDRGATCLDVATALAVYFSERQSGPMKDRFITFGAEPRIVDMGGCRSLHDKLELAYREADCSNTDIEATFGLLLDALKKSGAAPEDVPRNILIASDMQFDGVSKGGMSYYAPGKECPEWTDALFSQIRKEWGEAGYEMPRLVFWEINGRDTQYPEIDGVTIMSGFSTNTVDMLLEGRFEKTVTDRETGRETKAAMSISEQLDVLLSQPRYDAVQKAAERGMEAEREAAWALRAGAPAHGAPGALDAQLEELKEERNAGHGGGRRAHARSRSARQEGRGIGG